MQLVILESPYAAGVGLRGLVGRWRNRRYARRCVRDSLLRGEAPIASHLLYTQRGILNDQIPAERQHGIDAGLAWRRAADATIVYIDRGISSGMRYGVADAVAHDRPIIYRTLRYRPDGFHGLPHLRQDGRRPETP